jgi:radical SAM protein with 4Fe4S-binding SPASM domain
LQKNQFKHEIFSTLDKYQIDNMDEQKYEDWSLGIHERLSGKRVPIGGSLELTQRCNNRCVHCYNNLAAGDHQALAEELSTDEHCRIIDEMTDCGCLWLLLTGGEIFLRKDFFDIYAYAKQKGLLITLFTNGNLITPDIADALAQLPPFSIEITLYGSTKQTYESITGVPGSYARCLNGIRLLMARRLPLKLKTMVIAQNKREIFDLKRFVEAELELDFKFDAMINPRRDCSLSPLEVRLKPFEVVELDLEDPKRVTEWRRFAALFHKPAVNTDIADKLYLCGGGHQSFAIDSFGQLTACVLSGSSYDLRPGSFREGWEDFLFNQRQKKTTRRTKCTACLIKPMCGMCPANSELECRDAEAPVEFLCEVAHLRAYAFGIDIAPHGDCEYCSGGSRYADMMNTVENLLKPQ